VDKKPVLAPLPIIFTQYFRKKFWIMVAKNNLFRYLCTPKMKKGLPIGRIGWVIRLENLIYQRFAGRTFFE
jgi:hypothetical protein